MSVEEHLLLKKRRVIESINDILMTVCDIDHTRHRSSYNFAVNLFAGLIACTFHDKRSSIYLRKLQLMRYRAHVNY